MRHTQGFVLQASVERINSREDLPCVGGLILGGGVLDEVTMEEGARQLGGTP